MSPTAPKSQAPPTPTATPTAPPTRLSSSDSVRNCQRMSFGLAPTDWRMPISRVRSVTLTSMMFMIPMPPTISDTPATQESSERNAAVVDSRVLMMSSWVVMLKSGESRETSWRLLSSRLICRMVSSRSWSSATAMVMARTRSPRIRAKPKDENFWKTTVIGVYSRLSKSVPPTLPFGAITPMTVSLVVPAVTVCPIGSLSPNSSSASPAPSTATFDLR